MGNKVISPMSLPEVDRVRCEKLLAVRALNILRRECNVNAIIAGGSGGDWFLRKSHARDLDIYIDRYGVTGYPDSDEIIKAFKKNRWDVTLLTDMSTNPYPNSYFINTLILTEPETEYFMPVDFLQNPHQGRNVTDFFPFSIQKVVVETTTGDDLQPWFHPQCNSTLNSKIIYINRMYYFYNKTVSAELKLKKLERYQAKYPDYLFTIK